MVAELRLNMFKKICVLMSALLSTLVIGNELTTEIINLSDCRESIQRSVCLLNGTNNEVPLAEAQCLGESKQYVPDFEYIFDHYPPVLQATFCSLEKIFIDPTLTKSTAYSMTAQAGKFPHIVIRKDVLDLKTSLADWLSWREQLSFGKNHKHYNFSEQLPEVTTNEASDHKVPDFLFWLIAHEMDHLLDFSNRLNAMTPCKEGRCSLPNEDSFAALSWHVVDDRYKNKVMQQDDFYKRHELCFYKCKGSFIKETDIKRLYTELQTSSFISTYAATSPWEDFADTLAFIVLDEYMGKKYQIKYHGVEYSLSDKLHSKKFKAKYQFVQSFLNKNVLRFP